MKLLTGLLAVCMVGYIMHCLAFSHIFIREINQTVDIPFITLLDTRKNDCNMFDRKNFTFAKLCGCFC